MLKTSKIKVDDKLLELISADSLRVNRFGLYVTVAAIVFILILCPTSLWFIDDESRKLEASAQTAVNQCQTLLSTSRSHVSSKNARSRLLTAWMHPPNASIKQKTAKCLPLSLRCIQLSGKWSSHNPTVPFVPPAEVTSTPK